jgi:hypothetical protein
MLMRLYFLLPDAECARKVVYELSDNGVPPLHIHAHCRDPEQLSRLPRASFQQRLDALRHIEYVLWRADLLIFFVALIALIAALVAGSMPVALLAVVVMAASFLAGELFATHIPNVHLDEFNDALRHHEVLLMVDVKQNDVARVESLVEQHHPAAVIGGSSWTLDVKGI